MSYIWKLYTTNRGNTFFLSTLGTWAKSDDVLGHKRSLSKFGRFHIMQNTFSGHREIKLELWKGVNVWKFEKQSPEVKRRSHNGNSKFVTKI